MKIAKGSKVLFIGDSITDCGRAQPVGEGLAGPYGSGWVNVVAGLLGATYPSRRLRLVNMGLSGNTSRDLVARWDRDVVAHRPDWVVVMIGTNDVWRQFDLPLCPEQHVLPDEYARNLETLVADTLPRVKGVVLMTPFFLEPLREDAMRSRMDEYSAIVRETAARHGLPFVDVQAAMDRLCEHQHSAHVAWDRVHPNVVGHVAIARAFLDAVGYDWSGGEG